MAEFWNVTQQVLFYLAIANVVLCGSICIRFLIGFCQIKRLGNEDPDSMAALPKLSVIVAALDEEKEVEGALRSVLAQDYDDFEVIFVNDRSTDCTGEIADRLASEFDRLQVVHIHELPKGWLGKNHALQVGARLAEGEFLLFTDADIVMEPTTWRHAVAYAIENEIDHLPMMPEIRPHRWWIGSFMVLFVMYLYIYVRPWKVKNPKSKAHVGIGAFNLIRSSTYRAIGMHEPIRMRPDDDLMLGKLVKKNGFRQELLHALGFIHLRHYTSLRETIQGMEKNAFSGVDYSVLTVVFSSMFALVFNALPFVAVFFPLGVTQILYGIVVGMLLGTAWVIAYVFRIKWWQVPAFPLAVLLFVYIQWRTMFVTFKNGGIRWRGTHYPLSELKANRV